MIFTEAKFFVFFAVAFVVYWSIPSNEWRKIWLLAGSVFFYASWDWRFLSLVFFVIANTYATTLVLASLRDPLWRHRMLVSGITLSLSVLGVFKYYNFFIDSAVGGGRPADQDSGHRPADRDQLLHLPFAQLHDRHLPSEDRSDHEHGRCRALYPVLSPARSRSHRARHGSAAADARGEALRRRSVQVFPADVPGRLFQEVVVSDNLSMFIDAFYAAPGDYGAGDAAFATVFYSIQIYCDFSGYTDMAIGHGAACSASGSRSNFRHRRTCRADLTDFWRRWHISPLALAARLPLYPARRQPAVARSFEATATS